MPSPAGSLSQHPAALLAASQSNSSSVFRQLLHEVLVHSDSNSLQHEADLSINVQLVKVVVSAGLLVLFPASNRGISPSLVSQAADCLLVIRLTLKRTPEILAFADSSEQTLLFWLLPRLLSLLGVPHLAELQQDLEDTLSVLFSILHSSSLYWPVLPSLYASMIDLTRDVLDALAPPETVKAVNSRSWDRRVSFGISPPTTSHTALVVVQDLFEFHFMHPQQAFVMPLKVVSLLMRQLLKDTTKNLIPGLAFEMTTCCSKFVSLSDQWFSLGINMQQPLLPILFDISLTVLRSHLGISILKLQIQFLRLALNAIEKHSNEKSHFFLNDSILTFYDGLCEFLNCGTRNGNISEFAHLITAHLLSVSRDFTNTLLDVRKSQKRIFNIIESKIPPGQTRVLLSHLSESNTQDAMEVDINAKLSYRQAIYFSSDDIMRITCSQTGGDFRPKDTTANQIQLLASWLPSSEDDHSIIIIQAIGRMFCARAHPLELSGSPSNITHYRCPFCDNSPNNEGYHMTILADLEGIFVKIDEGFARSMQSNSDSIRQSLLQTLLRISRHTYYITSAERTGWLLQLLHSKHRLVRLISGRILSLQFRSFPNEENNSVLQENRRIIFNHLRTLSNEDEPRLTETNILCWAQLGRFAVYEELNIILAKLINDLGHSNSFIRAVAFQEVPRVTSYMKNRPQIIQAVSELLGITLTDFLSRTQSHTLPYLVYHKRQDIIEEIAQASKKDVPKVCFDNMPKIMAFLLVEVNERHETADVMSYLSLASPDFERIELPSLIRSEAIQTAVEILKMSDDQKNPTRRDRVFKALQFVSVIVCKPSSTSKDVTSSQVLHDFFRQHILGIMANISDTINDIRGHKTAIEKLQCVAAIGEIITTVGPLSAIAMPQILACLQSALAIPSLTKGTLKVWLILAKNLQPTEVKDLASTMFSILLQFWPQLKSNSDKSLVSSIFKYSFDNHFQALASTVESLPSLRTVPDLAGFDMHFQTSLSEANPRAQLQALISRCGHENISVCTQSLIELQAMLDVHENWLQCLILADKCDGLVIQLVRQLLDTCAKYRGLSVEITILCGECLGIVGAIDPSRLEISQSIADLVVLTNFQDAEESIGYTISLLDIHLVSAFRASLDTKAQGFLAYTMQELLKFCGFPAKENSKNGKSIVNPKMMRHWTLLSKASKETLSPLLSSKYFLTSSHSYIRQTYPIFPQQRNFREWLQNLTLDLCQIVNGENATKIFSACSRVIKDQDLSIANFVLPFVALNVIVGGSEQDRKDIVTEILEVLRFAVDSKSDAFESEKSKMACQVVFGLIDYANKWLRARRKSNFEKRIQHAKKANRYVAADEDVEKDEAINLVESVLSTIPADLMGRASSECGAHARSLYNWESYIRDKRDSSGLEELMPLYKHLQDVYARIDEPDGVEGISMRYPGLDADTQALEHEIAGRWSSALSCYELSLRENPCDPSLYLGLLRCLKQSGHYGTLILQLDRLIDQFPNYSNEFRRIGVEVGWMNENWEAVRHFLQGLHGTPTFETEIGRTLLALYEGDNKSFEACLNSISYSIVNVLAASGASVYRENYSMLIKLGIIREMSVIRSALAQDNSNSKALVTNLERRLLMTAPSSVLRQFILAVRKSTFSLAGPSFQREIASVWLDSAKVARKAGQSQLAYSSILQSTRLQYPPAILEEARWWWHEGHPRRAIQNLQTAFASKAFSSEKAAPSGSAEKKQQSLDPSGKPKNHIIGKATLLLARWLEVSGQSSSLDIEMKYKEAAKLTDKWEKAHFALGRHYCRLYDNEANQQPIKQNDAL
ncbi:Protein kinase rad3 [Neolecta irregularis DAH-3]|uniref:non-specific serine/threonine protein kinase n=1 Tax=Neolecta irregularis (strain DAH-3) TaxID=1198029 RepID=A0A1U7LVA5_NEOID|nr:Protein kinase rad3 [Neolecta irregularis DAH-3]|eukprot:OLL26574.1 Protein kinase rad3 [Neolecta irregularis DAH-3]